MPGLGTIDCHALLNPRSLTLVMFFCGSQHDLFDVLGRHAFQSLSGKRASSVLSPQNMLGYAFWYTRALGARVLRFLQGQGAIQ